MKHKLLIECTSLKKIVKSILAFLATALVPLVQLITSYKNNSDNYFWALVSLLAILCVAIIYIIIDIITAQRDKEKEIDRRKRFDMLTILKMTKLKKNGMKLFV